MSDDADTPMLAGWSETWVQGSDSCSDIEQVLRLTTDDAGGGPFLILSTERWSLNFDEIDNFCQLLKQFAARGSVKEK